MVSIGWRSVTIKAEAEKISEKMAKVIKVLTMDGDEPHGYTSRTGAKRQTYNASGIALREEGKAKRLPACRIVE
jgi:hypothetical protein